MLFAMINNFWLILQDFALRSTDDLTQFTGNVSVSFAKDPLVAGQVSVIQTSFLHEHLF